MNDMKLIMENNGNCLYSTKRIGVYIVRSNGNFPPLVGSGKILRRCRIQSIPYIKKQALTKEVRAEVLKAHREKERKKWAKLSNRRLSRTDSITGEKKIPKWGTSSVKIAFSHWRKLPFPMVRHKPNPNQIVFSKSILLLQKYLRKYSLQQIMAAMDLANETFNSPWFIYYRFFRTRKIALHTFIQSSPKEKRYLPSSFAHKKSILKEFIRGEKYIRKNYSFEIEDKHPEITQSLIDIWCTYEKTNEEYLDQQDKNNLVRCANNVVKFADLNPQFVNVRSVIEVINGMLNVWETNRFKPDHSGYLANNIFWEKQLPKQLLRFGTFTDKRDIKLI